jgi:hypothetical protein
MRTASAARVPGFPLIVAFARTTDFTRFGRDARLIAQTTEALLDTAQEHGFHTVHAQLLAAGRGSPFPPRVSLAHMLRGFARWRARSPRGPRLHLHVIGEELLHELDAQRIDLLELLDPETARFWVEISDGDGRADRELRHEPLALQLRRLADAYFTNAPGWKVTMYPGAIRDDETVDVASAGTMTLEEFGVLPGATLRFHRFRGR